VGLAFGTEYRREQLDLKVSSNFGSADLSGNGGINPPASGEFDVYELYGEARVPLVQDAPFAKNISLELGYRFADYSISGNASAYKIAGDWAITDDVRVRGGFNRAVRAPNIVEFFSPVVVGLGSFDDPCSGSAPAANCARTFSSAAAAAAQLGRVPDCAAAQCSQLIGGNPNLTPEKADTYTVGVVFTPKFLPGFNASVDWYSIKIKDPIVPGIGGALVLSQCIQQNQFCDQIHRAPNSGALFGLTLNDGYVLNVNTNSGSIKTAGLDVTANYRHDISDYGSLALQFFGTYTDKFVTEPVSGLGKYDCAGIYGLVCGQPIPQWKQQARLTWNTPWHDVSASVNWRYIGKTKLDLNTDDPFLAAFGVGFQDSFDAKIKAYNYFDLAVNWKINDVSLRAGMNNIFDKDPPVVDANNIGIAGVAQFGNGNTYPGVYDTLGRTVFIGLTADF
jgi:outer membrane receptor protein involved in Fe transport